MPHDDLFIHRLEYQGAVVRMTDNKSYVSFSEECDEYKTDV